MWPYELDNFPFQPLNWPIQSLLFQASKLSLMEVEEYFHLSLMKGMGDVAIPNCMCSSMGYPHTKLPSKAHLDANLDLPPFNANHRLVALFVVVE